MEDILSFLANHNEEIQGISSILSVIIILFTAMFTLIYVRLTARLVNIPYKALLRPRNIIWKDRSDCYYIDLYNYGPGIATSVKMSALSTIEMRKESNKSDTWLYKKMQIAEGPVEIEKQEKNVFSINGIFQLNGYLVIEHKSLTGKKYKQVWQCKGYKQQEIKPIIAINRGAFLLTMLQYSIKKPYRRYKKWVYDESKYLCKIILQRLNKEGPLSCSYLADTSVKGDEEYQKILDYMFRKGLVRFHNNDSLDYEISEKGYRNLIGNDTHSEEYYSLESKKLKYKGNFKFGKFNGKGILYDYAGQMIYDGEWHAGRKNGKGIFYNNGVIQYIGDFKDDMRWGTGKWFLGNETIQYEGDWVNNMRHGLGKLYDESGNLIYEGQFLNNKEKSV